MNNLKEMWKKSKDLIVPDIMVAKDKEDNQYHIFSDKSTILYMISANKKITFCIPKKYCSVKEGYYLIDEYEKMIAISCSAKNKYEKFIISNIS